MNQVATEKNTMWINGKEFEIGDERNLLELIRKAGFDLPTFCYRSDLTIYGACRMCVVEIDGRGVQASCTLKPEKGMKVQINTEKTRRVRKVALELILANHERECTTCLKSGNCDLQDLSNKMGIKDIRFENQTEKRPIDDHNPAVVRDQNKCILCGACVRVCREIQGKSVLDFAYRGSKTIVTPAYEKNLHEVDCTFCGQCVATCPTGALRIKSDVKRVWDEVLNEKKRVVAQVAPAVRFSLGEAFGIEPGKNVMGLITAALRRIGFDQVFDTTFSADLTIMEEATEFIDRFTKKEKLPLFTSCCPAWVRLVEQKYPQFIENISSCKSPQQMFGSVAKKMLPEEYNISREDLVVVSIMPCTAKKAEASRPEFKDGNKNPDVDYVLTTQELIRMIEEAGINFNKLEPEECDSPFGMISGAGLIFGASGGVAEAAVRTAYEVITKEPLVDVKIEQARGLSTLKEMTLDIKGTEVKIAVVNTLSEAGRLLEDISKGKVVYDMVEIMACPGGCIGGAGQPYSLDKEALKQKRTDGVYLADEKLPIRKSHENPEVQAIYDQWLEKPNSHLAHEFLHTHYKNRKRIKSRDIGLDDEVQTAAMTEIKVCVGTSCYLHGSYDFVEKITAKVNENGLQDQVFIKATFCLENCGQSPNIKIDDQLIEKATPDRVDEIFDTYIKLKYKERK